ncbi:NERD domain-containing protein [Clostridium paraputrificum]|nr:MULTISPECIES: NERD domain-containing protein [Clostridium]MDB2072479.1 NERD domain-containing protein [Clostridium paraputrificum]MDB2083401.1 NERD domain-containing protein [Clostridium paraputrificum]MDB2084576.1 NERD domain-containing protein [Clostridium paraputrificum]MDB2089883.1 NERD domain-containing protein [Clostridium paraputrificum]MDB2095942.1 NERD domain-containing protein [Clostridium paraputrificum]
MFSSKSNGECDFILIHRDYGVMILEVKGGIISPINNEWSSVSGNNIKRYIQDPEKQANSAKYNLMTRFRRS